MPSEYDAIKSLVWYNGYDEIAAELIKHIESTKPDAVCVCPENISYVDVTEESMARNILWFFLVELFGSCGSSPRYGWIEQKEDAIEWLESILDQD